MPTEQVVIRPGMDENIDARHLPIGTPRLLQNFRVREGARFEKRPGQTAHGVTGLPLSAVGRMVSSMAGGPVVCADDDDLGSLVAPNVYRKNSYGTWDRLGRHGVTVPERRFGVAIDAVDRGQEHTCATVNGLLYVAFADRSAGTTVTIYQIDPLGVALKKASLSDAAEPRLIYANSVLYLVTREPSGGGTDIEVRTVSTADLSLGAATTLGSTLSANTVRFDACAVEGGTTWAIAYPETANILRVRIMSGTSSSVDDDVATGATAANIGIAAYEGEHVCVAFTDGTTLRASVLATGTLAGNTFDVRAAAGSETYVGNTGVVRTNTSVFHVVAQGSDQDATPTLDTGFLAVAGVNTTAVSSGPFKHWHYRAGSKPWTYGALGERRVLIWATNNISPSSAFWDLQGASFILDVSSLYAIAEGISYEHTPAWSITTPLYQHIPEPVLLETGRRATVIPWEDASGSASSLAGIDVVVWTNKQPSESIAGAYRQTSESGGALYISGSMLCDCAEATTSDTSVHIPENGFPHEPEIALAIAAGGSLTAGRLYTYKSVYRWMDSIGRVHRSAPSEAKSTTPTGGDLTVTVRISTLSGSAKVGAMSATPVAEVYRSWSGGPYYYVGSTGAIDSVSVNDVSTTYSDAATDASLESNRVLYTDLGVLPTDPPSGARLICQGGQRLFVVGWKPNVIQFSKLYIPTAPWEFVDDNVFRIDVQHEITALSWLGGSLVIFTADKIYTVSGDGPNDQGLGSFSDPIELPTSVGADSPHVVEGPAGLFFKGGGTIWLLPRGFGPPQPIGDMIQRTMTAYPFLRGAVRCANDDDDLIHFLLADSDLPSARTLLVTWNNVLNAWGRDQLACDIGAIGSVGGVLNLLIPTWSAVSQTPARKLEGSVQDLTASGTATWIESRVGFGDFRPFGPLGWGAFKSLQIHGERAGTCKLNLAVTVDGALYSTPGAVATYTVTKELTSGSEFYAEHIPRVEMGGSWRFDMYDSVVSGVGMTSGLVLHSLAYEAAPEDGPRRVPFEERF